MSNVQTSAERTPHDLGRFVFTCGDIGRVKVVDSLPVLAGDSFEMDMVGNIRLSPLRRGLAIDSKVDVISFYIPHRHTYGDDVWTQFMKDGVHAQPLPSTQVGEPAEEWASGCLGTLSSTSGHVPKWLSQGYLNIFNNYFKNPDMPDLLDDGWLGFDKDGRTHGLKACHLKNIWTASLPGNTPVSKDLKIDGANAQFDIMQLNAAYAQLHTEQERELFMQRYRDIMDKFGGSTHYDADARPHMLNRSEFWASGYDVDGTDQTSLGQFSGRVQQSFTHKVPRFFVPEHGCIITVMVNRFPPIHLNAMPYYVGQPNSTYLDITGDPALVGNMPPRRVATMFMFKNGAENNNLLLAESQWLRTVPDHVDLTYRELEGFPFLSLAPTDMHTASTITPWDYDPCFQTMQLRHWNAQIKTNVTVYRALPSVREAVLTSN